MYRTTPPVIHLKDYSPPEFLIDQVDLRFDLDLDETLVEAELSLRRNPAATRGNGDLRLDGEQLQLIEVALDGRVMPPAEYQVQDDALIVHRVPDRFQLAHARSHPAQGEHRAGGAVRLRRHALHPV